MRPHVSGNLAAAGSNYELEIHEAELSQSEHLDVQRDPRAVGAAPLIPWKLIEPVGREEVDLAALSKETWGVTAVGAPNSPFDGSGITVAILDTGIDLTHPAFAGMTIEYQNFTEETDDDINGHGTHCAGTIFGQDVYGTRIGVARGIERALVGKVLGEGASTLTLVKAINWAVENGAHVISMSLGMDFTGRVEELVKSGLDLRPATSRALEAYRLNVILFADFYKSVLSRAAFSNGIVFAAASGNDSQRPKYEIAACPPAVATGIVAVGALRQGPTGYMVAPFSNSQVEISAPGVSVISAKAGGGLMAIGGTSMATPHVAGVAALYAQRQLEKYGEVNSDRLRAQLIASGTMGLLDPGEETANVGTGIVQAPLN
jgi:subtilisin family serine protease